MRDFPLTHPRVPSDCDCAPSGCCGSLSRRDFLTAAGAAATALLASRLPVMAGPFAREDFDRLVPADKRLDPAWVTSLFERGTPAVFRDPVELKHIGMPVGGLCSGQLYIGGDGRLWHWDIFNKHIRTGAEHYAEPMGPVSPVEQGFALRVGGATRRMDSSGWKDIAFRGEYPIARVTYRDPACPVDVALEAFSPFVPLDTPASSLPATALNFTLHNGGTAPLQAEIAGWLENAVCLHTGNRYALERLNRIAREGGMALLECAAKEIPGPKLPPRPTVVFADFEGGSYGDWTVEGDAPGSAPADGPRTIQKLSGFLGKGLVNTWTGSDKPTGKLTSPEFIIGRRFISFLIGGGRHVGQTCVNLVVDGKVARTAQGANTDALAWVSWPVGDLEGKRARIEIVDQHSGGWGHIDCDQIEFADEPRADGATGVPLAEAHDFGTLALALLDAAPEDCARARLSGARPEDDAFENDPAPESAATFPKRLVGSLARKVTLAPGESRTVTFLLAWHFPNLSLGADQWIKDNKLKEGGRHYATRFTSAREVVAHLARHRDRLFAETRLWRDTWYDSTLPHWFLDRTLANASTLATSTSHRLRSGRFYGWEGVGCCAGTCTHVWHYAHSVARLFPDLERSAREMADFGIAFDQATGSIGFRGEFHGNPAIDGQCGCILRAYREHQMSPDGAFLLRVWPRARKALEFLIAQDANGDGIIEGKQHNTLDADWYGPVSWLSGLYLAALRAGEEMAREAGDAQFADRCHAIFEAGQTNLVARLFEGDYFINRPDPAHADAINSGTGCHIDQVFGQSWAFQVALGRVLPEDKTRAALRALWRYNFSPDVGPYREAFKPGRWYALAGEAGLLMCTFPRTDWSFERAQGKNTKHAGFAGYFNECMNGFEHQVAGHMIWEGMTQEGLAIFRAVHDRYHPLRRNPWNEVECGDHYARSMASHGVYLAACGFAHHGPKNHIGFAPRLSPENFRAAFTAAEGWGSYSQIHQRSEMRAEIALRWGRLRAQTLTFELPDGMKASKALVLLAGQSLAPPFRQEGRAITISLETVLTCPAGEKLVIAIS